MSTTLSSFPSWPVIHFSLILFLCSFQLFQKLHNGKPKQSILVDYFLSQRAPDVLCQMLVDADVCQRLPVVRCHIVVVPGHVRAGELLHPAGSECGPLFLRAMAFEAPYASSSGPARDGGSMDRRSGYSFSHCSRLNLGAAPALVREVWQICVPRVLVLWQCALHIQVGKIKLELCVISYLLHPNISGWFWNQVAGKKVGCHWFKFSKLT